MSNAPVDIERRKFLTAATAVIGGAGVAATAVPFIKSWSPSAKTKAAGAPIEIDFSKIAPGQLIRVEWRGKPVWVVHRSQAILDNLTTLNAELKDPLSEEPQQPDYTINEFRSIKSQYFIAVGICTHLGCSPTYVSQGFSDKVKGVPSGFFCPCHGSSFDMAGRVFRNVPAPLNLVVPPHYYLTDTKVVIGQSQGDSVG